MILGRVYAGKSVVRSAVRKQHHLLGCRIARYSHIRAQGAASSAGSVRGQLQDHVKLSCLTGYSRLVGCKIMTTGNIGNVDRDISPAISVGIVVGRKNPVVASRKCVLLTENVYNLVNVKLNAFLVRVVIF